MQKLVNKTLVHYSTAGEKSVKTILFLHGWGRNLNDWGKVVNELSKKHYCVSLDLPGFGATVADISKPWSVEDYSKLIIDFCSKLNIKPEIIIAHSFGGKMAVQISNELEIKRLVLISPSIAFNTPLLSKIKNNLFKVLKPILKIFGKNIYKKVTRIFGSDDYKNAAELLPTFKNIVSRKMIEETKAVLAETLIIWGGKDKALSIKNAKIISTLVNESRIRIVWGAGHDPHLTHTKKLLNILEEEKI